MQEQRVKAAAHITDFVGTLDLSVVSRGRAASAYALSKVEFHTTFLGLWPDATSLVTRVARMVCRDAHPVEIIYGSPKTGGFAVLPLKEHTKAMHAKLALDTARGLLALDALDPLLAPHHPMRDVPLHAPLAAVIFTSVCPNLHPAQTLLCATESSLHSITTGCLDLAAVRQRHRIPPGPALHMAVSLAHLGKLAMPAHELSSALQVLTHQAGPQQLAAELQLLTWPAKPHSDHPITTLSDKVTVRVLASRLSAPHAQARFDVHMKFVAQALGRPAPRIRHSQDPNPEFVAFRSALAKAVTDVPCSPHLREPLLLLAANSFPGAQIHSWACPCCGHAQSARQHAFWDCPIAQTLIGEITRCMPAHTRISQANLWLLISPHPSVTVNVWILVAMAFISACEYGRKANWKQRLQQQQQQPGGGGASDNRAGGSSGQAEVDWHRQAHQAVLFFWSQLQEFVDYYHEGVPQWLDAMPHADHPFVCMRDGVMCAYQSAPMNLVA